MLKNLLCLLFLFGLIIINRGDKIELGYKLGNRTQIGDTISYEVGNFHLIFDEGKLWGIYHDSDILEDEFNIWEE